MSNLELAYGSSEGGKRVDGIAGEVCLEIIYLIAFS
jgi:hypothetical protein